LAKHLLIIKHSVDVEFSEVKFE